MLTPEDKAIIAEYMGWGEYEDEYCRGMFPFDTIIHFDLNDASLCVEKMIKEVDWESFFYHALGYTWNNMPGDEENSGMSFFIAWLFNPDNFFQAMAAWLRQK
jgi:hypothetical protein